MAWNPIEYTSNKTTNREVVNLWFMQGLDTTERTIATPMFEHETPHETYIVPSWSHCVLLRTSSKTIL
ncbi:hypothetical protein HanXRQr2_Chr17g0817401 [Helianthus annuus]|uniref:Uncharacterized protein n=1 Tax=Helianthus annuus TaxID=4232 RepID=A0A9K3GVM0_HELAN|nr:hypothetical protein HanXRQr2_Chr17g0817401 [Helianthus annuus]KAJ0814377.1 hypothetical protein HanPSC8_Chr17g0784991 [Helianthus annuus]